MGFRIVFDLEDIIVLLVCLGFAIFFTVLWIKVVVSDKINKIKHYRKTIKENRDKIQKGIPPEKKQLSFCSNKVWHNGTYHDGKFWIVGDSTKTSYEATMWYLL